jgi:hypothetical protein
MPISKYFSGHGNKVMESMKKEYGEKKGKQVFYATANKRKQGVSTEPSSSVRSKILGKSK